MYLIATVVFFFVWIYTMAPIMAVPAGYREAADSFGVTRWQMFRHVLLPGALPQIIVGIRVSAGVAVLMVIAVEMLLPRDGIGYYVNRGRELGCPTTPSSACSSPPCSASCSSASSGSSDGKLTPWAPEDNTPGTI